MQAQLIVRILQSPPLDGGFLKCDAVIFWHWFLAKTGSAP
jgi:hypothetical protein